LLDEALPPPRNATLNTALPDNYFDVVSIAFACAT